MIKMTTTNEEDVLFIPTINDVLQEGLDLNGSFEDPSDAIIGENTVNFFTNSIQEDNSDNNCHGSINNNINNNSTLKEQSENHLMESITNNTHNISSDSGNDYHQDYLINEDNLTPKTVEKIKITVPQSSPTYYSSSSESTSSSSLLGAKKHRKEKKYCKKCDIKFRKTFEFLNHIRTHVENPTILLEQLNEQNNNYYREYLARNPTGTITVRSDLNVSGGLKLKLKLFGPQNFHVIKEDEHLIPPQQNDQQPPQSEQSENRPQMRILTAKEIKLSPSHKSSAPTISLSPPLTTTTSSTSSLSKETPLDAMEALAEMTFDNEPGFMQVAEPEKVHFECPTLDGLDQFNEEVNKDTAAHLLKQLLENPQGVSENEWAPNTSSEFISIDRLAHICTICHSNFPTANKLQEHRFITGHEFDPRQASPQVMEDYRRFQRHYQHFQQQQQQQQQHQLQQQQQHMNLQHQQQMQQQQQNHPQHGLHMTNPMLHRQQIIRARHQQQMAAASASVSGQPGAPGQGPPGYVTGSHQPPGPINQMQHQVRSFMHHSGQYTPGAPGQMRSHFLPPPPGHQLPPPRRTPPPLYRVNANAPPNGGPSGTSSSSAHSNQPLNMAPFMGMNPDMYNPIPGTNGINGGNMIHPADGNSIGNSGSGGSMPTQPLAAGQRASPHQQRGAPTAAMQRMSPLQQHQYFQQQQKQLQQQQQQHQQQLGGSRNAGGPTMGPVRHMLPPMGIGQPQLAIRSPMYPGGSIPAAVGGPSNLQMRSRLQSLPIRVSGHPGMTSSPPQSMLANRLRPAASNTINSTPPIPTKKIKLEPDTDDCQLISMQSTVDGPIIKSVQGNVANGHRERESASNSQRSSSGSPFQLSDQITLSVKGNSNSNNSKSTDAVSGNSKNPKDVADILAHRGITVTPTNKPDKSKSNGAAIPNESTSNSIDESKKSTSTTTEEAVQKIQLNSSVSIISKKKTTTIDLSNDDGNESGAMPPPPPPPLTATAPSLSSSTSSTITRPAGSIPNKPLIQCPVQECNLRFFTVEGLNRHTQRGHKSSTLRVHRCKMCPAKFATSDGLIMHQRKVHRLVKTSADELGLPVVDLLNEHTRMKLASMGIVNYIPLTNLNKTTGGAFGLPIVSVQGAANSAICNLASLGADSVLSLGPIKQLPIRKNI